MRSNCILPSRDFMPYGATIFKDPCLSRCDDYCLPKHWEKSKPISQIDEIDNLESVLDRQFEQFNATKSKIKSLDTKHEVNVSNEIPLEAKQFQEVKTEENCSLVELEKTEKETNKSIDLTLNNKAEANMVSSEFNLESMDNHVTSNSFLASIQLEICEFLLNIDLFKKPKRRIDEFFQHKNKIFLQANNSDFKFQSHLNESANKARFLFRNSDEIVLRKRKGLKRKASFNEIY